MIGLGLWFLFEAFYSIIKEGHGKMKVKEKERFVLYFWVQNFIPVPLFEKYQNCTFQPKLKFFLSYK